MKKMIAIAMVAAMVLPMTAYGATGDSEDEQQDDSVSSALGEAWEDIKSAYGDLKEEVGSAVKEFGTSVSDSVGGVIAGDDADDKNSGENEDQTYESTISNIQEDFQDTIEQLNDNLAVVYEEVGDTYEDYVENKGYIFDWFEDCKKDSDRLFERTGNSAEEYYKYVASSVDRDYESLDNAISDFYDEILDEAFDSFYDDILDETFDDIYDRYYDGIIEEGSDAVDFSDYFDEYSEFYEKWINAYSEIYAVWLSEYSYLYSDWLNIWSEFVMNDNFDVDDILSPSEEDILTVDNCPDFADMIACEDSSDQIYDDFYDEHEGEIVEFDGNIVLVEPDSRQRWDDTIVYDDGFYDIMIRPGDYEEDADGGPQFFFDGTTASFMGYEDTDDMELPPFISEGTNVHVVAKLSKYDDEEGLCYLKPVFVVERDEGTTDLSGKNDDAESEESKSDELQENDNSVSSSTDSSGIDPNFKDALDSYEAFIDDYIAFMEKYENSDDTMSMFSDYMDYIQEYSEMMEKLDVLGESDMNAAELQYYTEVTLRCSKKLLDSISD